MRTIPIRRLGVSNVRTIISRGNYRYGVLSRYIAPPERTYHPAHNVQCQVKRPSKAFMCTAKVHVSTTENDEIKTKKTTFCCINISFRYYTFLFEKRNRFIRQPVGTW